MRAASSSAVSRRPQTAAPRAFALLLVCAGAPPHSPCGNTPVLDPATSLGRLARRSVIRRDGHRRRLGLPVRGPGKILPGLIEKSKTVSVVVGDQRPERRVGGCCGVPDRGGEGEQSLEDFDGDAWGLWPPCCSRLSWPFKVSLTDSMIWRSERSWRALGEVADPFGLGGSAQPHSSGGFVQTRPRCIPCRR